MALENPADWFITQNWQLTPKIKVLDGFPSQRKALSDTYKYIREKGGRELEWQSDLFHERFMEEVLALKP